MKVQRVISIDYKLNLQLKREDNTSELINKLLIRHFNKFDGKTEKQILKEVAEKMKQIEIDRKSKEFIKKAREKAAKEI